MREIKFRAWDKGTRLITCESDGFVHTGRFCVRLDGRIYDTNLPGKNWGEEIVLMQYTGLKDKNGVEIYEGDIVKVDGDYEKMFEVSGVNEIKFYCGSFMVGDYIKPLTYFVRAEDTSKSFMEIIGNIWENPELLK